MSNSLYDIMYCNRYAHVRIIFRLYSEYYFSDENLQKDFFLRGQVCVCAMMLIFLSLLMIVKLNGVIVVGLLVFG